MTALRFPSGDAVDLSALPSISSGRTTLANGSEGAQLQPALAQPPRPRFPAVSTPRLLALAEDLATLSAQEPGEAWADWAANVQRQATAELVRRAL